MELPDYYNQHHSADLNKISGRLPEAKEFILSYDPNVSVPENASRAYKQRWYGNASEANAGKLTRHFAHRLVITKDHFLLLRKFLDTRRWRNFPIINHFFMVLDDKYYRWASSEFLARRYSDGILQVPQVKFDQELKEQLPESVGAGSLLRYGKNLRTALRDNGLLKGRQVKIISSPVCMCATLAFMLYSLGDFGAGAGDFDGSPLFFSLLKSREELIPLFLEGEKSGYWEFIGDSSHLSYILSWPNLATWMEAN